MQTQSPPSPRLAAVRRSARRSGAAGGLAAFALLSTACGGERPEPVPEEVPGCVSDAECGGSQACQAGSCVPRPPPAAPPTSISAGAEACAVVTCPDSDPDCCSGAAASATGNQWQSYSTQLHMLEWVGSEDGEVRALYHFDAPNQQGWLIFELGAELELRGLEIVGRHTGVADNYLSVNTNQRDGGGCAFGFDLEPRPAPEGSSYSTEFAAEIELDSDNFCYNGGRPGTASELAVAIFSEEPGPASLLISSITLTAR